MPVETHLGARGLCTGIVRDVRNWSTLPAVGPHGKLMYVLRGRRAVFVVGLVTVIVLAYVVLVHLRAPACVKSATPRAPVHGVSTPSQQSVVDAMHDMRSLIGTAPRQAPQAPPHVPSSVDMSGLAGDMFNLYNGSS